MFLLLFPNSSFVRNLENAGKYKDDVRVSRLSQMTLVLTRWRVIPSLLLSVCVNMLLCGHNPRTLSYAAFLLTLLSSISKYFPLTLNSLLKVWFY